MLDYTLTEQDIIYCRKAIEGLDEDGNGIISIHDLETVLERMGIHHEEFQLCKLTSELDLNNNGTIEFEEVLEVYKQRKIAEINSENDQDTLDAYTAIGGPPDKSGHIDEKVLIQIINEEFELPINMEELIKSVDDSCNGEIEYEEFYRMLQDQPGSKIQWLYSLYTALRKNCSKKTDVNIIIGQSNARKSEEGSEMNK